MLYNITVVNDMGHLEILNRNELPVEIINFVYKKIKNKVFTILINNKNSDITIQLYALKYNLDNSFSYNYGNNVVIINYELFNKKLLFDENYKLNKILKYNNNEMVFNKY